MNDEVPTEGNQRRVFTVERIMIVAVAIVFVAVVGVGYLLLSDLRGGDAPRTALEAGVLQAEEALRADPDNVLLRLGLADVYFQFESYEDALDALDDARALETTGYAGAYVEVGYARVYEALGDVDRAKQYYTSSLEIEESFDAQFALGSILYAEGDAASAIEHWLGAMEVNPGAATLRLDIAQAQEDLGLYDDALEQLYEAQRYIPDDPEVQIAIDRIEARAE